MREISATEYKKICTEIQKQITQTTQKIFNSVTRQKVEMAWQIGQIVNRALENKDEKTYGESLMKKLENDVKIDKTALYKMRSFYKKYPELPTDDPKLNWSHYRILSGIKESEERKLLEDLTRENLWDSDRLQQEVSKRKGTQTKKVSPKKNSTKKIQASRGKIYNYRIVEIVGTDKKMIDCGFKIFREASEKLPRDAQMVLVSQKNDEYLLKKSSAKPQQIYVYKAYLNRVVDGDTIHANIDLGFGMWHEEIIRLAKINASESNTDDGKKATEEITKLLTSAPFFILKSIKTDIFNRYVADIFLPQDNNETNLQKIADKGLYLNQLLLDRGVAEIF